MKKQKTPLNEQVADLIKEILIDIYSIDQEANPKQCAEETIQAYNNRTMTQEQNQKMLEASAMLEAVA